MSEQIAVVIPVYNAKKYLDTCIRSVLNQIYQNFCLILVNDGSTDGSDIICNKWAKKDNRIHVIHQENRGSVMLRQAGVLSHWAQSAKYIYLMDADDVLPSGSLKILYDYAKRNNLDCVCGSMVKIWKIFRLKSRCKVPCFNQNRIYTNKEIIDELYISCFGISNYPVSLCAKLYRTELLTEAIDNLPIVKFMGDDLSVTLRVLPKTKRLGIVSDIVYNYRIGGNTSRYMPYMLDDFLSLYRFKSEMRKLYSMPQDSEYLMAVEMLNILMTWFEMFKLQGHHTNNELLSEIERVAALPEVIDSLQILNDRNKCHLISEYLQNNEYNEIVQLVIHRIKKDTLKRILKNILYSL